MSKEWQDLYRESVQRERDTRYELHLATLRLIQQEAICRIAIGRVGILARSLKEISPSFAAMVATWEMELRKDYEAAQPPGAPAGDQASNLGLAPALLPVQAVPSCAVRVAPVHTESGPITRAPF